MTERQDLSIRAVLETLLGGEFSPPQAGETTVLLLPEVEYVEILKGRNYTEPEIAKDLAINNAMLLPEIGVGIVNMDKTASGEDALIGAVHEVYEKVVTKPLDQRTLAEVELMRQLALDPRSLFEEYPRLKPAHIVAVVGEYSVAEAAGILDDVHQDNVSFCGPFNTALRIEVYDFLRKERKPWWQFW